MGTLKNGLAGHYEGKIGNLVFYLLKGKQVVRTRGKHKRPASIPQLQNRSELSVVMQFLKPIREFVNAGFAILALGSSKTPYNLAVSYNKINAVAGIYPNVIMDFSKILVSRGGLLQAINPAVELNFEGLTFSWEYPPDLEWPRATDQVMLLAYFPEQQRAEYKLYGARRSALTDALPLPADLLDKRMEVYISFIAENRREVADSAYLNRQN